MLVLLNTYFLSSTFIYDLILGSLRAYKSRRPCSSPRVKVLSVDEWLGTSREWSPPFMFLSSPPRPCAGSRHACSFSQLPNLCGVHSSTIVMGHGISVSGAHREKPTVFVDEQLIKGCKELVDNPSVRSAFLNYIKGGEWLDHITKIQQTQLKPLTREQRLAMEHDSPLYAYSTTDESRGKFDTIFSTLSASDATSGHTLPTQSSSKNTHPVAKSLGDLDGCYFPIDNFCSFKKQELIAVMLSIVLPLFKECADVELYFKQKPDEKEEAFDDFSPGEFQKPPLFTQSSRRAQACLLSCAANYQESELAEHVSDPHWPDHVDSAFDNYHLPIAVIDTNNVTRPFVFVNKAFERVFELSRRSALGRNYDEFSGPETEEDLMTMLQEALRTNVSCKVAVTHYTASARKKKFLDFVAVRASGGFTFAVHCPGDSPTLLEDVKMVDDVLLLMSYVVHAPPALKRKRNGSWIPNLGDLRGMNRPLVLSRDLDK